MENYYLIFKRVVKLIKVITTSMITVLEFRI